VAGWFDITWEAVGRIAARVVQEALDPNRLKGLEAIGVDEFHFGRKKVLTIVVNHVTGGLIWAEEGVSADVLGRFFELLGQEGRDRITVVTIDMSAAYKSAVEKALRNAEIVYDPFHVTKLVIQALDELRREEFQDKSTLPKGILRRVIYAFRKNPWNLNNEDTKALREVTKANHRLYRGYLLKESLLKIYEYACPAAAGSKGRGETRRLTPGPDLGDRHLHREDPDLQAGQVHAILGKESQADPADLGDCRRDASEGNLPDRAGVPRVCL
jgi:transposase